MKTRAAVAEIAEAICEGHIDQMIEAAMRGERDCLETLKAAFPAASDTELVQALRLALTLLVTDLSMPDARSENGRR